MNTGGETRAPGDVLRDAVLRDEALRDEALRDVGTAALARMLGERLAELARREVELARVEARIDLRHGMMAGGLAGASGFAVMAALVCGLFALLTVIGRVLPPVWVALAGMVIFAIAAIIVGLMAASEAREARPERSIRQARETMTMLREAGRTT